MLCVGGRGRVVLMVSRRERGGKREEWENGEEVESAGERNLFNDVFFCLVVAVVGASRFGGQLRLVKTRLGVGGGRKSHV